MVGRQGQHIQANLHFGSMVCVCVCVCVCVPCRAVACCDALYAHVASPEPCVD